VEEKEEDEEERGERRRRRNRRREERGVVFSTISPAIALACSSKQRATEAQRSSRRIN